MALRPVEDPLGDLVHERPSREAWAAMIEAAWSVPIPAYDSETFMRFLRRQHR